MTHAERRERVDIGNTRAPGTGVAYCGQTSFGLDDHLLNRDAFATATFTAVVITASRTPSYKPFVDYCEACWKVVGGELQVEELHKEVKR